MELIAAPAELTFANIADFVQQAVGQVDEQLQSGASAAPLPAAMAAATVTGARAQVQLDLAALTLFDSAAIAGLVALERRAQARKVLVQFLNAPPNLRKLASLYAVDGLLFGD